MTVSVATHQGCRSSTHLRCRTAFGQRCQRRFVRVHAQSNGTFGDIPKPKTVSLVDAFKFNGPAPETVNGRLAMLGLLAAAVAEAETSRTALDQLTHAPWPQYVILIILIYGSLVPMLKGVQMEGFGIFTPRAEVTNGRAAMLGFAVLLALEWKTGVPFF